jgi:hypothetical protein
MAFRPTQSKSTSPFTAQAPTQDGQVAAIQPTQTTQDGNEASAKDGPAITVPKGGGSIRSMGEKFTVDTMTGTPSISLPIETTRARSGIDPNISLVYSSGGGNGPFGLGWQLSLQAAAITRKIDKGIPRYRDSLTAGEQDDTFVISGLEDLVIAHKLDAN